MTGKGGSGCREQGIGRGKAGAARPSVRGDCRKSLGVARFCSAERNAFGRQLRSFEADVELNNIDGGPVHGVFIRAPWVAESGDGVEVLGSVDGHPVAVRQGNVIAVAFHPELAGEARLHELLLAMNGAG